MKKSSIYIGIACVIVVVAYFVYPYISPLFIDKKVSEEPITLISNTASSSVVNRETVQTSNPTGITRLNGTFVGFDRIHHGTGTVNVSINKNSYIVRFESDFEVQNGPDLYVGFGKDGKYIKGSEIGLLKGNIGSQNYQINQSFDQSTYNEVWIWCKQFSVPFARAILR